MDKEAWQQISFDKGHLLENVNNILLLMGKDGYGEGYDEIFDNLQVKQELDWKFRSSKYGPLYERHMKSLLSLGSVLKDPFSLAETIASEFIGDNNSTSVSYLSSGPLPPGDYSVHRLLVTNSELLRAASDLRDRYCHVCRHLGHFT
jgi:hypothetical protein